MEHLTNGWERDLDPGDSLLRTFVDASANRAEHLALATGGRAERTDQWVFADADSSIWFENYAQILVPCDEIDRGAFVAAFNAFYTPERQCVVVSALPMWDLRTDGFAPVGHPPLMFRPAGGAGPPMPAGFEIRVVDSAEEARVFTETIEAAYPMPDAAGAAVTRLSEFDGPVRLFVGYLDGKPVGTAGTWLELGVNQVEWISALEETRGRGVGAALTWASTVVDPTWPAVLIASDLGQPVYERLGYVRLTRVTMWMRPGA